MHSEHTQEPNLLTLFIFFVLLIAACFFCFAPPRRGYDRNEIIPYKIKLSINKYRLYIYSSGKVRQYLLFLVILSLYYSIAEPFKSELIKNISYSLMAAFIFDTGLNFSKENITKGVISTRWHNDLYSSFERMKAINKIYYPSNKEINTEGLSKAITSSLFNDDANSFAKRDFRLMWDLSSEKYLSYKEIIIRKGDKLDAVCLRFINDDYKFLVNFNRDEEVFKYFPSIMQPSLKTYRALSRLVNSIKDPSRFKFTTESLEMELLEYLELRNELFNDIEEVMGSYAQRAP